MDSKKLVLITGSTYTKEILTLQLKEYLGDLCSLETWVADEENLEQLPKGDLYLYSSLWLYEEIWQCFSEVLLEKADYLKKVPSIIGKRNININNIEELFDIEENTEVLLVNDIEQSMLNLMEELKNLGINHCKFNPYYPGIEEYKKCEIAVTPGEIDKVPKEVKKIINLGARPFDITTLIDVSRALGNERVEDISNVYLKKMVALGNKFLKIKKETNELKDEMKSLINKLSKYEKLFSNNITKEKEVYIKKRYYAKYDFENILSRNNAMEQCKDICRKLATTDLSILIEGESGTGKELFASAIHNASKRKDKPFLAINFSAITESLVESELFGYEEGAFTGARKGGKAGVFEQANGGTIFLDEIADAPLSIQTSLLRVLQEREIMKVGGEAIIPVNVRVISASNKSLIHLVREGKFREDLYYRLKMGYLYIPPLRDRKEDIPLIANDFVEKRDPKVTISQELMSLLCKIQWRGNIRELINALEYAMAICHENILRVEHLPKDLSSYIERAYIDKYKDGNLDIKHRVLKAIYDLECEGQLVGRKKLSLKLTNDGLEFSEQKVRVILSHLNEQGLIIMGKGKIGTRITEYGINIMRTQLK